MLFTCSDSCWAPLSYSSSVWDGCPWSGHKFSLEEESQSYYEYSGRIEVLGSVSLSTVLEKWFLLMTYLPQNDDRILSSLITVSLFPFSWWYLQGCYPASIFE